jgi:hypothetical protein
MQNADTVRRFDGRKDHFRKEFVVALKLFQLDEDVEKTDERGV